MIKAQSDAQNRGLWRTLKSTGFIMGAALIGAVTSAPAQANSEFEDAHSLRSLDIMLMVTALRCRTGPHNFQSDYHRFSATHLPHLKAASRTLTRTFAASYGETNPSRALDRMGVKIANAYGGGHPWMSCEELQKVARDLSHERENRATLAKSARYLLSASRPASEPVQQIAQSEQVRIGYNMTAEWEKRP